MKRRANPYTQGSCHSDKAKCEEKEVFAQFVGKGQFFFEI